MCCFGSANGETLCCLLITALRDIYELPQPLSSLLATYLQIYTERINLNLSCDGLRMESFRPHVCMCAHQLISMAKKL